MLTAEDFKGKYPQVEITTFRPDGSSKYYACAFVVHEERKKIDIMTCTGHKFNKGTKQHEPQWDRVPIVRKFARVKHVAGPEMKTFEPKTNKKTKVAAAS